MSELLALRDLPPVKPIEVPERYSQTLLARADVCPRSAYLQRKYGGGAASHPMNIGSLAHAAIESCVREMQEHDEPWIDPDTAKALLASVIEDHPELSVPTAEQDRLREMIWHFVTGAQFDMASVIAVERTFILEVAGVQVSGRIDLALRDGDTIEIRDWKSNRHIPDQATFEDSFQTLLYSLLLLFGHPVKTVRCEDCKGTTYKWAEGYEIPNDVAVALGPGVAIPVQGDPSQIIEGQCPTCKGSGEAHERDEPLDVDGVQWVRVGEWFLRYVERESGQMQRRERVLSRTELHDRLGDLERKVGELQQAFETWKFPAIPGSHCSTCPSPYDCPLPERLRDHQGVINTQEQAAEAAEHHFFETTRLGALWKELRGYAKTNGGRIRFGKDLVLDFTYEERRETDWTGLESAVQSGESVSVYDFVQRKPSTRFKRRTLSAEELAVERDARLDVKYGSEPPF